MRLQVDARHALAAGGRVEVRSLVAWLAPTWGWGRALEAALVEVLGSDPLVAGLPDGTWCHVGAAVHGRTWTTRVQGEQDGFVRAPLEGDLALCGLAVAGWDRVPVRVAGEWVLAEVVEGAVGVPAELVRGAGLDAGLLGVVPTPEGLHLGRPVVDEAASRRLGAFLRRDLRARSGWTGAEVELAAIADDPTLRSRPTAPVGVLLADGDVAA